MGQPDRPEHAEVLGDVRARVFVSGRVQGVFFRYSCAREASDEGLRGTVRNLPDGRVEAVFQGPKPAVERLIAWCRERIANYKVPRRVDVVDALPLNASGKILKFELRQRAAEALAGQGVSS